MSVEGGALRLAVLIDADNTTHQLADEVFRQVATLGDAMVRRIYGDFGQGARSWLPAVARHAIVPHQQFANVPNKNATDIALVIDAMDLLHGGRVDAFCIVASDSDYTRLATRIRDAGKQVFGIGKKQTASSFRQACHEFFEVEIEKPADTKIAGLAPLPTSKVAKAQAATKPPAPINEARMLLLLALGHTDDEGWVALTELSNRVRTLRSTFTPKAYGSAKLISLVRKTQSFDDRVKSGVVQVRKKPVAA